MILTFAKASVSRVLLVRGEARGEVTEATEEGDPGLDGTLVWSWGTLRPRRARAARPGVSGPTSSVKRLLLDKDAVSFILRIIIPSEPWRVLSKNLDIRDVLSALVI